MLRRKINQMPVFVRKALQDSNLMKKYLERPPYQRNDYVGWINSAKLDETKEKRLRQMLEELKGEKIYMKMKWKK